MEWLKQYIDNYEGKSKEAKSLEGTIKTLFNGSTYLPWAVMERVTYMQDPDAKFEIIRNKNEYGEGDNILHTTTVELKTKSITNDKTIETANSMFTHFVVIKCTFLGKTIEEVYPVLGKKFDAPKVVDQQLVNKALQRAKAKVASRVTGLGLKLYEGLDLQFDAPKDTPKTKKTTKKETPVVTNDVATLVAIADAVVPNTEPMTETQSGAVVEVKAGVVELITFIHNNPNANVALQKVNSSVAKTYGFTIAVEDNTLVLTEKLNKIKSPPTFLRTLEKFAG